jgi:hypothetical protein
MAAWTAPLAGAALLLAGPAAHAQAAATDGAAASGPSQSRLHDPLAGLPAPHPVSGNIARVAQDFTQPPRHGDDRPGVIAVLAQRFGLAAFGLTMMSLFGWLFGARRRG